MAYPILAPGNSWYKGSTPISEITGVIFYDSFSNERHVESWNADVDNSGSIRCKIYKNGYTDGNTGEYVQTGWMLVIQGNGSGKIALNEDSSYLFSHPSDSSKHFSKVAMFTDLSVLDVSNCSNLAHMFDGCANIRKITIPDWNFAEGSSLAYMFNGCTSLTTVNIDSWDTSKVTGFDYMFSGCAALTTIDSSKFDTSSATNLGAMFYNCTSLTSLDLNSWDMSNADIIGMMFCGCTNLVSVELSNWNVSSVRSLSCTFTDCAALKTLDLSRWNITDKLTTMFYTFGGCTSLTSLGDISKWNTSNVTSMRIAFTSCTSLKTLDISSWDFSKATLLESAFGGCSNLETLILPSAPKFAEGAALNSLFSGCGKLKNLDLSNWDVSGVVDLSFMFHSCYAVKEIDVRKWDTSKVTNFDHFAAHALMTCHGIEKWNTSSAVNMNAMFHNTAATELDLSGYDTSKVKYFSQMFENSPNLRRIKGLEKWDTSQATGFDEMFGRCYALEELDLSSWDTSKAKNGDKASTNGHTTGTFRNFIDDCRSLKKLVLGPKFKVNGDGTNTNANYRLVLPTPSADYHVATDGYWYDEEGNQYSPTGIEDGARTYYASPFFAKMANMTLVKKTTIIKIADYIRTKTGKSDKIKLSSIIDEFESILKNHVSND